MRLHGLAAVLADAGGVPRRADGRDHIDLGTERRAHAVADGMVSVFAAARRADGTPGRRVYLGTVAPGGLLPSLVQQAGVGPCTLVAVPDGRAVLVAEPPGVAVVADALREGTEAFARVMLPFGMRGDASADPVTQLVAAASAMVAADAAAVADASSQRAVLPAAVASRFERMIGAMFLRQEEVLSVDPNLPPMLRACRHVAVESGVPLASIPRRVPDDPFLGPVESFALAARIGHRRIRLPDRWWRGSYGPLLAAAADGAPVALVPRRWSGYRAFVYRPGMQPAPHAVDASFAAGISPDAGAFAAALPPGPAGIASLLAFLLRGSTHDLWLAGAVALAASVLNLAVPLATGLLVGTVIPAGEASALFHLGAVLASTLLAVAACDLVTRLLLLRAETRATIRGSSAIVLRALQLPISFFQRHPVGELAERLGAIEEVQRRVTASMVLSVVGGVFSATYLVLMAIIDPVAASFSAAAFMAILLVTAFIARRQARHAAEAVERSGRLDGFALQLVEGIERVRTTCAEEHVLLQWLHRYRPARRAAYRASIAGAQLRVLAVVVPFAFAAFLWWRFGTLPGERGAQVGPFMAFNAAFTAAVAAVTALGYAIGDISEVAPLIGRLRPILEERPECEPGAEPAGPLTGSIALQAVRFTYPGSAGEALRGVSIEASAGDFIAIVGASGSGKSTLAQLVLGLRRPTAGKVLFDGKDLARLDLVSLRRQVGVVGQHAKVVPGTILENIVGATLLTQADAWEAAEAAGLAEDVREMPMQMHTFVNEHTLSGGQLQKLLIARALVSRPRVLLLDEATSALDEVSQAHVADRLRELAVTRIVIAHRLSTVRGADRIYVLSAGEVVESGGFDELCAADGPFRELIRRQLLESPVPQAIAP